MSDVSQWFNGLPTFTKWWMALTGGLSLMGRFGLINGLHLILMYEPFIKRFQIWRPITAVFFYPINSRTGFHFLINLYFLYNYSLRLETGVFDGRPADYCFLLLFNWVCIVIVALMAEMPLLMDSMVLSVLYVWCQLNRDVIVSFWFGTRFKAAYLPWVLFAFNLIISGGGVDELVGILVGHLYYFLMFKYPQEMGGPRLLSTPTFLYKLFPSRQGGVHGFGIPPASRRAATDTPGGGGGGGRHNWGRGYVLGDG